MHHVSVSIVTAVLQTPFVGGLLALIAEQVLHQVYVFAKGDLFPQASCSRGLIIDYFLIWTGEIRKLLKAYMLRVTHVIADAVSKEAVRQLNQPRPGMKIIGKLTPSPPEPSANHNQYS